MTATELSFLSVESEMTLQNKEKVYETHEASLHLFWFFLFCSFYSEISLLSSREGKSTDPSLIKKALAFEH